MCSILRKKDCMESEKCSWIVGKGCKSADHTTPPKAKPMTPMASKKKVVRAKKGVPIMKVPTPPIVSKKKVVRAKKGVDPVVKVPTPPIVSKKKVVRAKKGVDPVVKVPTPSPSKVNVPPPPKHTWAHGHLHHNLDDNFLYEVDYAPTNAAKCQGCKEKILKNSLRIGRHQVNPFGDGDLIKYYHAEHACDAILKSRCNSAPITWDKLNGTSKMTNVEKITLFQQIKEFQKKWDHKCKGK